MAPELLDMLALESPADRMFSLGVRAEAMRAMQRSLLAEAVPAVMQAIGVSPALGAFVAGVMLADSPYRHELEADIDPFRSILLGLFFLAVGMLLDVDVILAQPLFVASLALALVAVKITVIFALGRFFGLKSKQSIIMAMLLSQGGEFAFVLFTAAQQAFPGRGRRT